MTHRRVIIDHVDINVADIEGARAFYRTVLASLGLEELHDPHGGASFGVQGLDDFGIYGDSEGLHFAHVAFEAPSREAVDRFDEEALRAGGRTLSPPQRRPQFSERYYSAYVLDPEGNGIEAVFFDRERNEAAERE